MRFVLVNDDGINASGLAALAAAARRWGDVVVVAPQTEQSECSHSVTTRRPLHVEKVATDSFAVDGTPVDCVRVALEALRLEPDWILAGINHGGNLGYDVWMSGTVAAAREAALRGIPAAAFSQYLRRDVVLDWDVAQQAAERILGHLLDGHQPAAAKEYVNINLPATTTHPAQIPICDCPLDPVPMELGFEPTEAHYRYRGNYHGRHRTAGSDVDRCFSGAITLTRLTM
jgi:5'-nucleotidase